MDTIPFQSVLTWLGQVLGVGLGFLVAAALIILLMLQVLLDAYHSPLPVKYPQRTKLITAMLLVAFGVGILLRILQLQGPIGQ